MLHTPDQLCRAARDIRAAPGCLTCGALQGRPTIWACSRHAPHLLATIAPIHDRADNIGDNIACALHRYIVADPDITLTNIVGIMQARSLDCGPCQSDGQQVGYFVPQDQLPSIEERPDLYAEPTREELDAIAAAGGGIPHEEVVKRLGLE